MGCGLSTEANGPQGASLVIGPRKEVSFPNGTDANGFFPQTTTRAVDGFTPQKAPPTPDDRLTLYAPPPNEDDRLPVHGAPTTREAERFTARKALEVMSHFLRNKQVQLTLIVVGDVLVTLFLGDSIHDDDVLGSSLKNAARFLLDMARDNATRQSPPPLGSNLFNTEKQTRLPPAVDRELTDQAIQENQVLFNGLGSNGLGLRVLAAPREYAFSDKVSRLLTGRSQLGQCDLIDAVRYLNQIVSRKRGSPVPIAIIEGWARKFRLSTNRDFLMNTVNAEYWRQFGSNGIVSGPDY